MSSLPESTRSPSRGTTVTSTGSTRGSTCGRCASARSVCCHPERRSPRRPKSKDPFTRENPSNKGILRLALAALEFAQNDSFLPATAVVKEQQNHPVQL